MKDKILLVLYIVLVIFLTFIHDWELLLVVSGGLFFLSGRDFFQIFKKSVVSVVLFNGVITVSYIGYALYTGKPWIEYIFLINLRVFVITYLTFLFVSKVNLFNAFSFSKTLMYLLTLSYTQILIIKRQFQEFKYALTSRIINKPSKKDSYNFISKVSYYFLTKAIQDTKEITDAMKSRGFFIE